MATKKNILESFGWFLEKLHDNFVKKSGDTMTGPLTISNTEIKQNDEEPTDKITVLLPKESGTLQVEPDSVTMNYVYAGPTSADGKPEFRALVSDDIPEFETLKFANTSTSSDRTYISGQDLTASYTYSTNTTMLSVNPRSIKTSGVGKIVLGCRKFAGTSGTYYTTAIVPNYNAKSITITLPSSAGTLALKSDIPDILTSDNTFSGSNTFTKQNSFVSGWDATTGNEASSDYQLIVDCPIMNGSGNNEYYPAIWFRDNNLSGDYADKNILCLLWNTNENCLSTYDLQTNNIMNLTTENYVNRKISALNEKIIMKKEIVTGLGGDYIFLSVPDGYTIMTAVNPNWANEYYITGVSAYTSGYTILFFNKAVPTTATFSVNSFWYKTS